MPYPNEHSCRIADPGSFDSKSFRRVSKGGVDMILGKKPGSDSMEIQAFRFPKADWSESRAREFCATHKGSFEAAVAAEAHAMPELSDEEMVNFFSGEGRELYEALVHELPTVTIPAVQIFGAGTWITEVGRTSTYSDKDMEEMAASMNEIATAGGIKAPLRLSPVKIGHDYSQRMNDGKPAVGAMANYKAVGGKLYADLVDVPRKVAELIKAKAYRFRSAEIIRNFEDAATGKTHKFIVAGLALLGDRLPALTNLAEISSLYGFDTTGANAVRLEYMLAPKKQEENHMEPELLKMTEELKDLREKFSAIQKTLDGGEAKFAEAENKIKTLSAEIETKNSAIEKYKAAETERQKAAREVFAKSLIRKVPDKNIRDVLVAAVEALEQNEKANFAMADGKTVPLVEAYENALNALPDSPGFKEEAKTGRKADGSTTDPKIITSAEYESRLQSYAASKSLDPAKQETVLAFEKDEGPFEAAKKEKK